jgi:hypothetical protein
LTRPPSPLVRSGRRSCAGPGHQFGRPLYSARPIASLIVIGLVATFVLGPALVAVLSIIFAGRLDGPNAQPIVPFNLVPILETGRVLVTLALATKLIRTREWE